MRDESLYLADIVEARDALVRYLSGVTHEQFLEDDLIRSAVLHKLTVIGEAAGHISNDLRARHPEVEWSKAVAFRNFAVHTYFGVDWDIVWLTATNQALALGQQAADILNSEFPPLEDTD
jgi:uncharacterized protein with HEPN domain